MAALVYIHGFLSSPLSYKAQQIKRWLAENHPALTFHCPQLPPYPFETRQILEELVETLLPEPVYLVGSSLGGFWATWLVEKYNLRAVLINPAVRPYELVNAFLGKDLTGYHTAHVYRLYQRHIDELKAADVAIKRLNNYWLLIQSGDETLDYRHAVAKYRGCRQTLEQGGDHGFQGLERHFNALTEFLQQTQ